MIKLTTPHFSRKIADLAHCGGPPAPPKTPQNPVPGAQKIGQNDYNLVTRPPIKILRPLFTLQLLILPTRDPFQAQIS